MPPAPSDSPVGRAEGPAASPPRRRPARSRQGTRRGEEIRATRSSGALEALLVDLGSQIHRGDSFLRRQEGGQEGADQQKRRATGLPELDLLLGGGFPKGLCEVYGPPSSGRTSLVMSLLGETLARGVLAAWVDGADAFDPRSAAEVLEGGPGALERLLWIRARNADEAIRACDRLLQTEGIELVVLDRLLSTGGRDGGQKPGARAGGDVTWLRLGRVALSTRTTLVVLGDRSVTGSRSELVLETRAEGAHFVGPPDLLEALEIRVTVQRHRGRPLGENVSLSIQAMD